MFPFRNSVAVGRRLSVAPVVGNYWICGFTFTVLAIPGVGAALMPRCEESRPRGGLTVEGVVARCAPAMVSSLDTITDGNFLVACVDAQCRRHVLKLRRSLAAEPVAADAPAAASEPAPAPAPDAGEPAAARVPGPAVGFGPTVRAALARCAGWLISWAPNGGFILGGKFQCRECKQDYQDAKKLWTHYREKHGGGDIEDFDFACKRCNTVFNSAEALRNHTASHKKEEARESRNAPRRKKIEVPDHLPPAPTPPGPKLTVVSPDDPAPEPTEPIEPADGRPTIAWPQDEKPERAELRNRFPHARIVDGRKKNRHPWLRVHSEGVHIEVAAYLRKHHAGKPVVDVGSNRSRVLKARATWHGCCPTLLAEDVARKEKYARREPEGTTWCSNTVQTCPHKAGAVFVLVYSAWYLTDEQLLDLVDTGPVYAVVFDFAGPADRLGEATYRLRHTAQGLEVEMDVPGNTVPYVHRVPGWLRSAVAVRDTWLAATTIKDYGVGGRFVRLHRALGPSPVSPGPGLCAGPATPYGAIYPGKGQIAAGGVNYNFGVNSSLEAAAGLVTDPTRNAWISTAIVSELTTYAVPRHADPTLPTLLAERSRDAYNRLRWPDDLRAPAMAASVALALESAGYAAARIAEAAESNRLQRLTNAALGTLASAAEGAWDVAPKIARARVWLERRWTVLRPYAPYLLGMAAGVYLTIRTRRIILGGDGAPLLKCILGVHGSIAAALGVTCVLGGSARWACMAVSLPCYALAVAGVDRLALPAVAYAAPVWEEAIKSLIPAPWGGLLFGAWEGWYLGDYATRIIAHTFFTYTPAPVVAHAIFNTPGAWLGLLSFDPDVREFAKDYKPGDAVDPERSVALMRSAADRLYGDSRDAVRNLTSRVLRISQVAVGNLWRDKNTGLPALVDYCPGLTQPLNELWSSIRGER